MSDGEPTRAQRALREAARKLREAPVQQEPVREVAVPVVAEGLADELEAVDGGFEEDGVDLVPLFLDVDELYVGSPTLGGVFAYRDAGGEVLATVEVLHLPEHSKLNARVAGESARHVDERWVVAENERPVFYVERYRAAGSPAYGVFGPDGGSLGTFMSEGGALRREVVVREASSAPVATMRTHQHRHVITHASGAELGYCWRAFSAVDNEDDDEVWGMVIEADGDLLDRRALVGAPLVCHLMAYPKRHFDRGGELGLVLLETVPPVGLAVMGVERAVDGLYWLRRRLD